MKLCKMWLFAAGGIAVSVLFTGCYSVEQANRVSTVNLHYTDYHSNHKTVRFAEMSMIGKKRFFENAVRLTELSKQEGFVLFYEHLDFEHSSDTLLRKVRRIQGFVPSYEGYKNIFSPAVANGFIIQDHTMFLNRVNDLDIPADITPGELIDTYEAKFGEIRLKPKDFATPLNKTIVRTVPLRKTNKIMLDYRSERLARSVQVAPYERILVLYGARHRKGFFKELEKLDSSWTRVHRNTTFGDPRFDHSLPPDTVRNFSQNGWIEKMGSHITMKLSLNNDIESFFVDTEDLDFEIYPNTSVRAKLSLNYRFISFSYSYDPRVFPGNDDDDIKGTTKSFGLEMNFTFSKWFQGLSYHRTQGYYLRNTPDLDSSWEPGDPYLLSPELVFTNFQGVTGYSFNPKFSVASLTAQTERQLHSAGTFTPQLHYRYYIIDNREEITPGRSTQKTNNTEAVLSAGYHHTFVIKQDWYLNAGADVGGGYLNTRLETRGFENETTNQDNIIFRWGGRAGLGYNGRRFFAGGLGMITGTSFRQENTTAMNVNTRLAFQVFAGYRFGAPKFVRERFE